MKHISGLLVIFVTLAACGAVATAQQTGKVPRIGFLDPGTASGSAVLVDAFRRELRKLGWIEGKNITIEYRFAENKGQNRLAELAVELVRLKVDLIVTTGVQQATKFDFIINLKAAKQIGLTISPDMLARANRVIK
jgi:ABC-type uncharacterized transport system substrate-binding protein